MRSWEWRFNDHAAIGNSPSLEGERNPRFDPFEINKPGKEAEDGLQRVRRTLNETITSDIFLTGTNAITKMANWSISMPSGTGVSGMVWAILFPLWSSKETRSSKTWTRPLQNQKRHCSESCSNQGVESGRNHKTPCAITGECSDCRAIERICNIFSVIEGKPFFTDLNVILVNQDFGLGWDPLWPKSRIEQILENYRNLFGSRRATKPQILSNGKQRRPCTIT